MGFLEHRDMTDDERASLEREVRMSRGPRPGWSSTTVAVAILVAGSFVLGLLLFGLPATYLFQPEEGTRTAQAALFLPACATLVVGGSWSIAYYLRGSWRISPALLEDLDYGRVEVLRGRVDEAWVVDDPEGTTWLLDFGEEILLVGPPATRNVSPRTFPGRMVELVRCKHSGLVLHWETDGPPLAPSGRLRADDRAIGIESARYGGSLPEVAGGSLSLVA